MRIDKAFFTSCAMFTARLTLYLVVLMALCLPSFAQVTGNAPATVPSTSNTVKVGDPGLISWSVPTKFADPTGSPIPTTAVITYNVYQATPGTPWKLVATVSAPTFTSAPVMADQCWTITDVISAQESVGDGPACLKAMYAGNPPGPAKAQGL